MLTIFQTDDQSIQLLQTSWAKEINPLLKNPISNGILLQSISLANGTTQINHKLGRKLTGWILTRKSASADIYDTQSANAMPQLTLDLVSDSDVIVDLYVF